MHDYGMGGAALAGLLVYDGASRGSGRSTALVRGLVEDSLVVCTTAREAEQYRRLVREMRPGLKGLRFIVLSPTSWGSLRETRGHIEFTHEAWRRLYERAIEDVRREIEAVTQRAFTPTGAEQGRAGIEPVAFRAPDRG